MIWWSLLVFTLWQNNGMETHRLSVIIQNKQPCPTNTSMLQWMMLWLCCSISPEGCMEFRHVKSSDLSNLQPSIKEELPGISGLLTQVCRKFGTETKSQRTGKKINMQWHSKKNVHGSTSYTFYWYQTYFSGFHINFGKNKAIADFELH